LSWLDFSGLIGLAPWILVLGGFIAVLKLYMKFRKGSEGKGQTGIGILGFFIGVFLLAVGITVLLAQAWDIATWVLLVITGLALTLKPLSRIPFGALFGLLAGALCAGLLYMFFPLPPTILGISSLWIYGAVFLIPALLVFLAFKFLEDVMKLFSLLLGSWPVVTALGVICILQGLLLLLNQSIISLLT